MLRLNCQFTANEGRYAEALEAAKALTACSLHHQGCASYDVYESATRPGIFIIVERWADSDALAAHSNTPEFAKYVDQMNACGTLTIDVFEEKPAE